MSFLTAHEDAIRLGTFASVLVLMAVLEAVFPRKDRRQHRLARWRTNFALSIIDAIAIRLTLPMVAMGMAAVAAERGWGLFNLVNWPVWLEGIFAVLLLDMLIYWQHVAFHRFPLLWRFHKVHHADRDIDVTTGIRFHPIEIILSMVYKMACIILLGPALAAVFLFEIILNACAMFNHANLRLPLWGDRALRLILVTPDMHRIHHSAIVEETNSNYGFSLSLWDRVFKSYIMHPENGHANMTIGLSQYQDTNTDNIIWTLMIPFRSLKKKK